MEIVVFHTFTAWHSARYAPKIEPTKEIRRQATYREFQRCPDNANPRPANKGNGDLVPAMPSRPRANAVAFDPPSSDLPDWGWGRQPSLRRAHRTADRDRAEFGIGVSEPDCAQPGTTSHADCGEVCRAEDVGREKEIPPARPLHHPEKQGQSRRGNVARDRGIDRKELRFPLPDVPGDGRHRWQLWFATRATRRL